MNPKKEFNTVVTGGSGSLGRHVVAALPGARSVSRSSGTDLLRGTGSVAPQGGRGRAPPAGGACASAASSRPTCRAYRAGGNLTPGRAVGVRTFEDYIT